MKQTTRKGKERRGEKEQGEAFEHVHDEQVRVYVHEQEQKLK